MLLCLVHFRQHLINTILELMIYESHALHVCLLLARSIPSYMTTIYIYIYISINQSIYEMVFLLFFLLLLLLLPFLSFLLLLYCDLRVLTEVRAILVVTKFALIDP